MNSGARPDLVHQVATILGGDDQKARSVLGSVFTSVRMAVDTGTFSKVGRAFPHLDQWMRGIQLAQGRTGEIIALAGPESLKRQLTQNGLTDTQMAQVGAAVGAAVRQALPPDVSDRILQRVPLLNG
ncbi:MAG TPA: hypothetical protein VD793_05295 [Gemmatimonadales bacterium]|nr:hypothetical protein [Gemmatimonadales bacterium]